MINPELAIPLPKDIIEADTDVFIMEVSAQEISETAKQIEPLKVSGLNVMQAISYHKKLEFHR